MWGITKTFFNRLRETNQPGGWAEFRTSVGSGLGEPLTSSIFFMKHNKYPQDQSQSQKLAGGSTMVTAEVSKRNEADFAPLPDEVARKAYFSYVNQGSRPGHEVQHWLEAEAELLAERKLTRTHGFHNKT